MAERFRALGGDAGALLAAPTKPGTSRRVVYQFGRAPGLQ